MNKIILMLSIVYFNPLLAYDVVDEILEISETQTGFEAQYSPLAATIYRDEANANSEIVEIQELRKQVIEEQQQLFKESFSWDSARNAVKAVYFNVYSDAELKAYSDFLRTDSGKSFLKKYEQFVIQFRKMMEQRGTSFVEKKEAIVKEYSKQIRQYESSQ